MNWNGEGLPKAGDKVLFDSTPTGARLNGKELTVDCVYKSGELDCIAFNAGSYGIGAIVFSKIWIKPIKSDRDKAIDEMLEHIDTRVLSTHWDASLGALYDAGYRKITKE